MYTYSMEVFFPRGTKRNIPGHRNSLGAWIILVSLSSENTPFQRRMGQVLFVGGLPRALTQNLTKLS